MRGLSVGSVDTGSEQLRSTFASSSNTKEIGARRGRDLSHRQSAGQENKGPQRCHSAIAVINNRVIASVGFIDSPAKTHQWKIQQASRRKRKRS